MFVIKMTKVRSNKNGELFHYYSYWNAIVGRFSAFPLASAFPADVAEQLKEKLVYDYARPWSKDYIMLIPVDETNRFKCKSPVDAPQSGE